MEGESHGDRRRDRDAKTQGQKWAEREPAIETHEKTIWRQTLRNAARNTNTQKTEMRYADVERQERTRPREARQREHSQGS